MLNPTQKYSPTNETNEVSYKGIQHIMLRKIWLPKAIYSALPFIYICLGVYATYSALFREHWSWVIPYALLLACVCLHAGIVIATLRIRAHKRFQARQKAHEAGRQPSAE